MALAFGNGQSVGLVPERQELMTAGLPVNVSDTVQTTRGVSTQRFGELMCRKEHFSF